MSVAPGAGSPTSERPSIAHADALIVVDMQRAFLSGDHAVADAEGLLGRVEELLGRARGAGVPVVLVQNDGPEGAPDETGSAGWGLAVSPIRGDVIVRKTVDDAFEETDLGSVLRAQSVKSVLVTGLFSEMCVAATARGAMARGLAVILAHDGHATVATPAWDGVADAVPAEAVSRVAEWSLGDEVALVAHTTDVRFSAAGTGKE